MFDKRKREITFRIFSYIKPYKGKLLLVGLLLIVSTVVEFLQPLVIQNITDRGLMEKNFFSLSLSVLILAILILVSQGKELLQTRIFAEVHNSVYNSIFGQSFYKLLHLKKEYFEEKNATEILNFLQMDITQVASITDQYTVMCVSYIFRIFSGLLGLFLISWKLAIIVVCMIPVKYLLVSFFSNRKKRIAEEVIAKNRDFSKWFGDNLEGVDEIKLWNLFKDRDIAFSEKQKKILKLNKKSTMISGWNHFWEMLLEWSVTLLIYLVGGLLVCSSDLTIGTVFAFVGYSGYVTGPVGALINFKMYYASILPSAKRLFAFFDMAEENDSGTIEAGRTPPEIQFQNVEFSYTQKQFVLKNVSFHVKPGEKIAIIGKNGSGKSTILNLLLRFYEPNGGKILADGVDISKMSLQYYRSLFSVVSQEPYLFSGSITDNIDLNHQTKHGELEKVMRNSGVSADLMKFPQGSKTKIGRNGSKLSGGEKQKIAVARALVKDAPIVILDEATSNFDVESDKYLHDMIVNEMKNKTVIMITHHYKNLKGMNRVYELEDGKLIERAISDLI